MEFANILLFLSNIVIDFNINCKYNNIRISNEY